MKFSKSTIAKKRFGQHFLHDQEIIAELINIIHPKKNDHVIEIGAGEGALTFVLQPYVEKLDVIEIDRDLLPNLVEYAATVKNMQVFPQDALKLNLKKFINDEPSLRIVGNLPYNIGTEIIFNLLKQKELIKDMHFMLQYEVAERIVAEPGSASYGRLSVMIQYQCTAYLLLEVEREAFTPPPKVHSAFLRLVPHEILPYPAQDPVLFAEIVRTAFNQKRKTIHNSLKNWLKNSDFERVNIDANARPQNLSVKDFVEICNLISQG